MLARLLVYPVEFHEDHALLQSAYELAEQYNRPRAYDAQYLALAKRSPVSSGRLTSVSSTL
ncbi:type II toxin-antitoxin system VapC family toxin [bacterium]|jgi:predicted nucleic acid-binding protein|nr:type II toxin-antitoxin system VapC family toxin [bacterium]